LLVAARGLDRNLTQPDREIATRPELVDLQPGFFEGLKDCVIRMVWIVDQGPGDAPDKRVPGRHQRFPQAWIIGGELVQEELEVDRSVIHRFHSVV
jgi:hypothetical protein